ncbi:MAG: spore cortex biosynthesis protein YabQ [Clostridia bacterium]|nr:spore cortex biosynthesis protein YabQ [Clostridia bacterium]
MEISQLSLALFLLISAACGAILGALYDLTAILPAVCGRVFDLKLHERLYGINLPWIKRTLRAKKTVPREFFRNTAIFVHDLVFMLEAGALTAITIYRFNDGIARSGFFIGIIVGFSLYRVIFRKVILALFEILRFAAQCVLAYVIHALALPVRFIVKSVAVLIQKARNFIFRIYLNTYSKREKKRLLYLADIGFLNVKITVEGKKDARRKKEKSNSSLDSSSLVACFSNHCGTESYETQPDTKRGNKARSRKRGATVSR